ncbi:MAG TPA: hypothetical protein VMF06_14610 [Candidatus Limnocylindria bacterium]|nr:hypothetical protein [Candidatus Limnocylindria bacterium]
MRRQRTFLLAVRSEALAAERLLGITRADEAVRLAQRVLPESIPTDTQKAARNLVQLVFGQRREVPAN